MVKLPPSFNRLFTLKPHALECLNTASGWCHYGCIILTFSDKFVYRNLEQLLFSHSVFATPGTAACLAYLSFTISQSFLKLMSFESVMPSNHPVLCHPLLLLSSVFPSIRAFLMSWLCIRWAKYWSFSFSISPSNSYSELISFRIDWFDLFAVQQTLKNSDKSQ